MIVTLFTANNPRHLAMAERLAAVAETVYVIQECVTAFPGQVADHYRRSATMQAYFEKVISAESEVFGYPRFLPNNVRQLSLRMEDVSLIDPDLLAPMLDADAIVVFGASYIKGPLVERLIEKRAINIHMGVSPYYRGSSCNFWAMYDGNPDLVGATIHQISKGLDSGAMLYHVKPRPEAIDPFVFGMKAVQAAQDSLVAYLSTNSLADMVEVKQDRLQQIRYTKTAEFTDEVAAEYLAKTMSPAELLSQLEASPPRQFVRLFQP